MPELPDLTVYVEALEERLRGSRLVRARIASPFLVRTFEPPLPAAEGRLVLGVSRLAKRVVMALEGELFLVFHLMIAGRFRWREPGAKVPGRIGLAALDFEHGTLLLTEASPKRRASLHVLQGQAALHELDPGGIEPLAASLGDFAATLARENHTLKRALTDPRLFAGIGNAYSDEILHRARLSPVKLTHRLARDEIERLHAATRAVLGEWTARLRAERQGAFPEKVTAFRAGMAVHGRRGQPCPVCAAPVQRIARAENECNYCASCQTGGKLLADRALSRLLGQDWPRTLAELEELRATSRARGPGKAGSRA